MSSAIDEPQKAARGETVCYCFDISRQKIINFMSEPGNTVEALVESTGLGTKCTACLLNVDLILDGLRENSVTEPVRNPRRETIWNRLFALPRDFIDSGFFTNLNGVRTYIRVVNYGPNFDTAAVPVHFDYRLTLFDSDGKIRNERTGQLSPYSYAEFDIASIPGAPESGWFMLSLKPMKRGVMGSIRPQVCISGNGWAATYHTQPHAMACRGKSVVIMARNDRLNSSVSTINTVNQNTKVELCLTDTRDAKPLKYEFVLPKYGSNFLDLDTVFQGVKNDRPMILSVLSNNPIQKHIINRNRDGSWSLDHFPNNK